MEEVKKKKKNRKEKQQRNKQFFHSAFISKVPFSGACTREASSIGKRTFRHKRNLNRQQLTPSPDVPAGNPGKLISYWATRAQWRSARRLSAEMGFACSLPRVCVAALQVLRLPSRCWRKNNEANWQYWLRQLPLGEGGRRDGRWMEGLKHGRMDEQMDGLMHEWMDL